MCVAETRVSVNASEFTDLPKAANSHICCLFFFFTESTGTIKKVNLYLFNLILIGLLNSNLLMLFATQRSSRYSNPGKNYLLKGTFKKPSILKLTSFFLSFTLHVRVS